MRVLKMTTTKVCDFCKKLMDKGLFMQIWDSEASTKRGSKMVNRLDICKSCYKHFTKDMDINHKV